jgi:TonB-linked SusC/RagA family outer membrane protein
MARTILLFLVLVLTISQLLMAKPTLGQSMQEVYISVGFRNENLHTVLKKIERASNFLFAYQSELIAPYKRISLPKETRSVLATLKLVLEKTDLDFRQNGSNIILFRAPQPQSGVTGSQVAIVPDPQPQRSPVSGVVVNSKGEPVQGASVQVVGSNTGTLTDGSGKFSLGIAGESAEISISAVGFATQQLSVRTGRTIRVVLQESATGLNEVVVVGYGEQKKIDLTGSVVTLGASQIENRAAANVTSVLAGQTPGLTVLQQGGAPGRDAGTLYMHGIGTLGNASPLIVVDGIKTDSYTQIDPNDIASISVLKDAASSAIYGIDAANGVIIITTKRGHKGKLKVNYNFQYGGSAYQKLPVKVNSWQLATMYDSAQSDDGTPAASFKFSQQDVQEFQDGSAPLTHANSNWTKALFSKPGTWDSHNLTLTGGTDDTKYNISFGYLNDGGIMESTGLQKYTFRTNFDQKFSEHFSGGFNVAFTQSNIADPPTVLGVGGETWYIHEAMQQWPNDPIYTSNGTYAYPIWSGLNHNPVAYASSANGSYSEKDTRLVGTAFAEYKIWKGLKLTATGSTTRDYDYLSDVGLGVDLYNVDPVTGAPSSVPNNTTASMPATPSTTSVYRGFTHAYDNTLRVQASYDREFGLHKVTGLLGYEVEDEYAETDDITRVGLTDPSLSQINAANPTNQNTDGNASQFRSQSVYGRVVYNYNSKYLLEGNAREDATSRFAPGRRQAVFPSVSAGWVISREKFFEVPGISTLKIRGSYGVLGNQQINNYLYQSTYQVGSYYIFDGVRSSGIIEGPLSNGVITWEKTTAKNIALDFGFLQDRLTLTGEYYFRTTNKILLQLNQPAILGASPPESNAGSVQNNGYDFIVGYKDRIGQISYYFNGNINYVKNKITNLAGTGYPGHEVGDPIDNLYGYVAQGLFQNQSQIAKHADQSGLGGVPMPGDIIYKDLNSDNKIDASDEKDLGTYFPEITYGFSFGANYKGFDLSTVWSGTADVAASIAGSRLAQPFGDYGSAPIVQQLNNWTAANPDARFPRLSFNASYNYVPSSFWVMNTSYLKLRNAQIGYTLPGRLLKNLRVSRLRLYVAGDNLLIFSPFKIMDPESLTTGDPFFGYAGTMAYPTTKKYYAGLSLTF